MTHGDSLSLSRPIMRAGIRTRLLLLILLATLPALGLALYAGSQHHRLAAVQAQQEALRLAQIAASDHKQLIDGARQLLRALSMLPSVRAHDARACYAFFADLLKQYPQYANFGVVRANGDVTCSGLPLSGPINLADRAYIHRAGETRDFAVGDYQVGRITGKATINFGYPILDGAGQIQAVAFAALDLARLSQLVTAQLPTGALFVVIDRHGTILVRHPDPEKLVGQPVSGLPLGKTILAQGEGTVEMPDLVGVPRLFGFTSVRSPRGEPNLHVWIGIPSSVAYAEANRLLADSLIGLGLVGALALVTAWIFGDRFILRSVRALVDATKQLKAGDLTGRIAVTGRDELSTLTVHFNEMADGLQAAHDQLAADVKELERRARELNLLREIDRMTLAEAPLHDILSKAVEAFARLSKAVSCVLVAADAGHEELTPMAIWGPDPEGIRRYFTTFRPRIGDGGLGRAIAMREAVFSSDVGADPQMERYRDGLMALRIRAILTVPLLTGDRVLGAVGIGYPTARSFPEAEIQIMNGFANQLAVAWEAARFREDARERWRMEEANRIKARFIANMSHELRTPLNSIIGFTELLQDTTFGPLTDKQRRYMGHIHKSGRHLLDLISDIIDLSKVEADKIELRLEPLLVSDALETAVALMCEQAANKSVALELQVEERLPLIQADPLRFKQILLNLLSNAVKFTPDGGQITATAKPAPGEFVEIAVTDTGIGIKSNDLPRLFEEFVRLDAATAQRIEGTGLGLALTKKLVELHGGTIAAASEGEGRGSTFTIRLPVTGPAQ